MAEVLKKFIFSIRIFRSDRFIPRELLDRAKDLGRILFSQDDDLLIEANYCLQNNISGVIYSHQLNSPIGNGIEDLEIISKTLSF